MEKRLLNISLVKGGSGSTTGRIILPTKWLNEMGISKENRSVEVFFNGEEIRIKKNIDFIEENKK